MMQNQPIIETPRLLMRELLPGDEHGMFELDNDPEVHRYLGNNPVKTIEESRNIISFIRQQYIDNGIGRWAVIEKENGNFIGWSGLKFMKETVNGHTNYHDVGYRLMPAYWGKGYATESARAALKYAFMTMNLNAVYGTTLSGNKASQKALLKCGLHYINSYDYKGDEALWYKIDKASWNNNNN